MAKLEEEVADLRERMAQLERIVEQIRERPAGQGGRVRYADKEALRPIIDRVFAAMGVPEEPTMTPQEIQEKMIREGVRPEDYLFTTELAEMRGDPEERLSPEAYAALLRRRERGAMNEGLTIYNPETEDIAALQALASAP